MTVLLMIAKIAIVISYGFIIWRLWEAKKQDRSLVIRLDVLSLVEVSACFGLNLVALFASFDEKAALFTLMLCVIGVIWSQFQRTRMIFAADRNVYVGGKMYRLKDVKGIGARLMNLQLTMTDRTYSIYVPLTTVEAMEKLNNKR